MSPTVPTKPPSPKTPAFTPPCSRHVAWTKHQLPSPTPIPQLDGETTDPDPRYDPGPLGPEDPGPVGPEDPGPVEPEDPGPVEPEDHGPEYECPQILYNLLMI